MHNSPYESNKQPHISEQTSFRSRIFPGDALCRRNGRRNEQYADDSMAVFFNRIKVSLGCENGIKASPRICRVQPEQLLSAGERNRRSRQWTGNARMDKHNEVSFPFKHSVLPLTNVRLNLESLFVWT